MKSLKGELEVLACHGNPRARTAGRFASRMLDEKAGDLVHDNGRVNA